MNSKIKEIREMFLVFDDPMDKYIQIIELGKKNPGIPYQEKNEFNKIFGCASLAWVIVEKKNSTYNISIDSDTFIVKGLLSILKYIIDGSTIKQIDTLDIKCLLYEIGLDNSITSQRTNGFLSALNKIKEEVSILND
jgi:sulfur transfer protein SufE